MWHSYTNIRTPLHLYELETWESSKAKHTHTYFETIEGLMTCMAFLPQGMSWKSTQLKPDPRTQGT